MSGCAPVLELRCEEFAAGIVTDYMEGDLDGVERGLVEMHLAGCDGCSGLLERMRAVTDLLRDVDSHEPAPVAPELMIRFRSWAQERAGAAPPSPA